VKQPRKSIVGFTLHDELFASPTHPLPPAKQRQLCELPPLCVDALARPIGAHPQDWKVVATCGNVLEQLIEWGVCEDHGGLLPEAHAALRDAMHAHKRGEPLRLQDAAAVLACRFLVHDFAEILSECAGRTVVRAVRATDKRMHAIDAGRPLPGDVRHVLPKAAQ
jgi:hypothetical protein